MANIHIDNKVYGGYVVSESIINSEKKTTILKNKQEIVNFPKIFDEFAFSGCGSYFYGMRSSKVFFYDFVKKEKKTLYTCIKNFGAEYNKFMYKKIIFLHNNIFYCFDCETREFKILFIVKGAVKNITISKCKTFFTYDVENEKRIYLFN